jgi:hypothetical protein
MIPVKLKKRTISFGRKYFRAGGMEHGENEKEEKVVSPSDQSWLSRINHFTIQPFYHPTILKINN